MRKLELIQTPKFPKGDLNFVVKLTPPLGGRGSDDK
jgi:hypothetical protein